MRTVKSVTNPSALLWTVGDLRHLWWERCQKWIKSWVILCTVMLYMDMTGRTLHSIPKLFLLLDTSIAVHLNAFGPLPWWYHELLLHYHQKKDESNKFLKNHCIILPKEQQKYFLFLPLTTFLVEFCDKSSYFTILHFCKSWTFYVDCILIEP